MKRRKPTTNNKHNDHTREREATKYIFHQGASDLIQLYLEATSVTKNSMRKY